MKKFVSALSVFSLLIVGSVGVAKDANAGNNDLAVAAAVIGIGALLLPQRSSTGYSHAYPATPMYGSCEALGFGSQARADCIRAVADQRAETENLRVGRNLGFGSVYFNR